jgi:hypothetical protein
MDHSSSSSLSSPGVAMDRKAIIREYKERRPRMGVFQVRNTVTGQVLVGASTDLPAMLNRQRAQLRLGAHANRRLQADWQTHGADAFVFEVLDTLEPPDQPGHDPKDDLRVLEAMWLEKIAPFDDRGYNSRPRPKPAD